MMAVGHRFVHYVDPKKMGAPSLSLAPSQHADMDSVALRSLDFFLNSTALQLELPFESGTWSRTISCFMQHQPAVKHALIALAALHENYQHTSKSVLAEQRKLLALEHYGKSINTVVQNNVQDASRALAPTLVASLLFCAIESLQGHFSSAVKHIIAGVRLLSECEDNKKARDSLPDTLLDALRRIFISLGMQAMALEETCVQPVMLQLLKRSQLATTCSFSTIGQAQAEINHLQIDGMRVLSQAESCVRESDFPSAELQGAHQALRQRFRFWSSQYHDLLKANDGLRGADDHRKHMAFLTLRLNQVITAIILSAGFSDQQMRYDAVTSKFEKAVSTAEEICQIGSEHTITAKDANLPTFSMTLGIVPAMFFAAVRCRHYSIRRRALAILRMHKRRESVWDATITASVAEQVIVVEEKAAARYRDRGVDGKRTSDVGQAAYDTKNTACTLADLPESVRIRNLDVDFLGFENTATVSFLGKTGSREHHQVLVWDE